MRPRSQRRGRRRQPAARAETVPVAELQRYPVWDRPTRLIHLGLVVLLPVLLLSVHVDWIPVVVHLWTGYLLLALLLLRLGWGLAGSESARFACFVGGPVAVGAYLPRLVSRRPTRWPGHNPIGALYVVVILVLLLGASVSGLFYENWGDWRGPLAERVGRSTSLWLSDLHGLLQWPILALISVHIAVVLGYRAFKDEDRIGPMFGSGRIRLESDPRLSFAPWRRALLIAVTAALAIALLLRFGPIA